MKFFKTIFSPKKEPKAFLKNLFLLNRKSLNLNRYISNSLNNIFLLRFTKLFVKNKYPRNRQWSKNIIYFGIWLNVVIVYLTFLYCYHFTFNIGYIWWLSIIFVISLIQKI